MTEAIAIMGEVHTGLLQHSSAISDPLAQTLLGFVEGERVRSSQRPITYAVSPDVLTGVDCHLPTSSGTAIRGVGTVVSRGAITGNRIVQASAHITLHRSVVTRRLPWSHYLARRGVVEAIGKGDARHLTRGFLDGPTRPTHLDLGAICMQAMNRVQSHVDLDHQGPFRAPRGYFRWVVTHAPATMGTPAHSTVSLGIGADEVRRFRLPRLAASPAAHIDLCNDIALHDWLLTMLVSLVERGLKSRDTADVLVGLRPIVDHLMHLWMPGARTDPGLLDVWAAVERHPGMSRQWQVSVDRVRDQVALRTLERLSAR